MSASYLARAEEDLSCPLCLELFVDPNTPKQLSCPHDYCQICLEKMVEGGLDAVTCPECRAITRVPQKTPTSDGGIADLKTSLRLRSLAENHLKHIEKQQASLSVETRAKPSSVPTCPEHDEEKMHFYCVTCKVLACQACVLLDHDKTTHEIKGVKVVYKDKLAEMKKRIEKADDSLKCQDLLKSVRQQEKKVETIMAATESAIDRAVAEVLVKVKEQGENVKKRMKEMNQGKLQRYQQQKKKLIHDIQAVRTIKADVESTIENASPYEYLRKHGSLEEKIKKMRVDGQGEKMDIEEATATKWVPVLVYKWIHARDIKQIQMIEEQKRGRHVINVGGMNGTLAVCKPKCVSIYRKQQTGRYKHELDVNVAGSDEARDVAVTANGKILLAREDSVQVYKASGQYESTFHTRDKNTDKNTRRIRLTSITSLADGRVIIGIMFIGDECTGALTVHRPDGELIKTINVGFSPQSVTAMKNGQVALCNYRNKKVYVYNVDTGRDVLGADVQGVGCVCYDEETDCLMVGRWGGYIEQYCVSPWKLINTNRMVQGAPMAMIFADKDDLVVGISQMTEINVFRCNGVTCENKFWGK